MTINGKLINGKYFSSVSDKRLSMINSIETFCLYAIYIYCINVVCV